MRSAPAAANTGASNGGSEAKPLLEVELKRQLDLPGGISARERAESAVRDCRVQPAKVRDVERIVEVALEPEVKAFGNRETFGQRKIVRLQTRSFDSVYSQIAESPVRSRRETAVAVAGGRLRQLWHRREAHKA